MSLMQQLKSGWIVLCEKNLGNVDDLSNQELANILGDFYFEARKK